VDRKDFWIHFTRATALVGAVGAACFFVAAVAAQIIRADNDVLSDFVSDLAVGEQGGLMTTSFFLHGAAIVAVSLGLTRGVARSRSHVASSALIGLGGFGVLLLGLFPADAYDTPHHTVVGSVHIVLASISFTALSVAFLLFSHAVRHDEHWHGFRPYALGLGWSAALAMLTFSFAMGFDQIGLVETSRFLGLLERILIAFILAWILLTALRLRRVACAHDHFMFEEGRVVAK